MTVIDAVGQLAERAVDPSNDFTLSAQQERQVGNQFQFDLGIEGVEGATVEGPHNYYVQILLRVGLTGMFVFLLSYWIAISDLLRRVPRQKGSAQEYVLPLLLFSQLVYFIPYAAGYSQCVLLGIALACARPKVVASKMKVGVAPT